MNTSEKCPHCTFSERTGGLPQGATRGSRDYKNLTNGSLKEATLNPTNPRDRPADWEADIDMLIQCVENRLQNKLPGVGRGFIHLHHSENKGYARTDAFRGIRPSGRAE